MTEAMIDAYESEHKADWRDPSQAQATSLWAKAWKLAVARERERCAKVCETRTEHLYEWNMAQSLADEIRRGG